MVVGFSKESLPILKVMPYNLFAIVQRFVNQPLYYGEFLRLINWKVAWTATQGHLDVADASSTKVFGTEFYLEAFKLMMEIIGE